MKLVLCEKPSVGNTVAKVLGIKGQKDGYIECGDYIVSWCIGHLVGLALPEEYGAEYKKWDRGTQDIYHNHYIFVLYKQSLHFDL